MNQLTMNLGAKSGTKKAEPIKEGDILVRHDYRRFVVANVNDNIHGEVYVGFYLDTGNDGVLLPREVLYRSVSR